MHRLKRLWSPGAGLGAVALFVALGGTALADHLLTGDDIQNGSLTGDDIRTGSVRGSDLRNGTVTGRDLDQDTLDELDEDAALRALIRRQIGELERQPGPQGPAGPQGAQGPPGAQGAQGAQGQQGTAGASALSAVPSGETIRGVIGADYHNYDPTIADFGVDQTLPMPAPEGLDDNDISVSEESWQDGGGQLPPTSADDNAACTGTPANPTAPAGHVCIYVTGADRALNLEGYTVAFGAGSTPYGIKLKWETPADAGDTFVDAVWAYTAP